MSRAAHRAATAALLLLAVGSAAPSAVAAAPPATLDAQLRLGRDGGEATLVFPFALEQDAAVYAKLQPTPWSAVLPSGAPNGTVAQDRSAGIAGWWVALEIVPEAGAPIRLGHFADGGASAAVTLPPGEGHALQALVHAPPEAGPVGMAYRVDLALSQRAEGSGIDPTWSFAAQLTVVAAQAAPPAGIAPAVLLAGLLLAVAALAMILLRRHRRDAGPWL